MLAYIGFGLARMQNEWFSYNRHTSKNWEVPLKPIEMKSSNWNNILLNYNDF